MGGTSRHVLHGLEDESHARPVSDALSSVPRAACEEGRRFEWSAPIPAQKSGSSLQPALPQPPSVSTSSSSGSQEPRPPPRRYAPPTTARASRQRARSEDLTERRYSSSSNASDSHVDASEAPTPNVRANRALEPLEALAALAKGRVSSRTENSRDPTRDAHVAAALAARAGRVCAPADTQRSPRDRPFSFPLPPEPPSKSEELERKSRQSFIGDHDSSASAEPTPELSHRELGGTLPQHDPLKALLALCRGEKRNRDSHRDVRPPLATTCADVVTMFSPRDSLSPTDSHRLPDASLATPWEQDRRRDPRGVAGLRKVTDHVDRSRRKSFLFSQDAELPMTPEVNSRTAGVESHFSDEDSDGRSPRESSLELAYPANTYPGTGSMGARRASEDLFRGSWQRADEHDVSQQQGSPRSSRDRRGPPPRHRALEESSQRGTAHVSARRRRGTPSYFACETDLGRSTTSLERSATSLESPRRAYERPLSTFEIDVRQHNIERQFEIAEPACIRSQATSELHYSRSARRRAQPQQQHQHQHQQQQQQQQRGPRESLPWMTEPPPRKDPRNF